LKFESSCDRDFTSRWSYYYQHLQDYKATVGLFKINQYITMWTPKDILGRLSRFVATKVQLSTLLDLSRGCLLRWSKKISGPAAGPTYLGYRILIPVPPWIYWFPRLRMFATGSVNSLQVSEIFSARPDPFPTSSRINAGSALHKGTRCMSEITVYISSRLIKFDNNNYPRVPDLNQWAKIYADYGVRDPPASDFYSWPRIIVL